jgi:purine nucleosidase
LSTGLKLTSRPRIRVISDNDYAGDPDGLVQLAHLLLSPAAEVTGVIGSHIRHDVPWPVPEKPASAAAEIAEKLVNLVNLEYEVPVLIGSEAGMTSVESPADSAAAEFIVDQAMNSKSDLPLYVVCGGALTSIASAFLMEPRIAEKLTLVWIGGHGYSQDHRGGEPEFNLWADPLAAQVIFNHSNMPIWQVPESSYSTTLVSKAQVLDRMAPAGELGEFLWERYTDLHEVIEGFGLNLGEIFVFGDSPLVLLTALQASLSSMPSSCKWEDLPRPRIDSTGHYEFVETDAEVKVFTEIDTHLMVEDFFTKLKLKALQGS